MTTPPPRVLLTGGAGFVGRETLHALRVAHPDWHYAVADIVPAAKWPIELETVDYIEFNVKEYSSCLDAIQKSRPTLVIHSAGVVPQGLSRYSTRGRDAVMELNVGGTANMLRAVKEYGGVTAFLFTGSCTSITDDLDNEYPNFTEETPFPAKSLIYGESKARAEELVLAANDEKLATCSLRPSTILGREDYQLVPAIQACIDKFETPFIIGSGNNLYDFTYVENVAQAHVLAAENLLSAERTAAGEAILISNDQPITFRDFMLAIWSHWGHTPPFSVSVPPRLAWTVGAICEGVAWATGARTTLCRGSVKDAIGTRYCSQEKAKRILGYYPKVDLWEGLRISCDALKARQAAAKNKKKR